MGLLENGTDSALRFKAHLRVEPAGRDQVFLLGERERFLLQGRLYTLVAPLIDGNRKPTEIVSILSERASSPEIYYTLHDLIARGHVVESCSDIAMEAAAFWEASGLWAKSTTETLGVTTVSVTGFGEVAVQPIVEALQELGVAIDGSGTVSVVVVDDYLNARLSEFNRSAIAAAIPWMPVKPIGVQAWFGPVFRGEGGPCWECLATRVQRNRSVESFIQRKMDQREPLLPPRALLSTTVRAAACVAATALADWIGRGRRGVLDDKLFTLTFSPLGLTEHAVVRLPQCSVCGDPNLVKRRVNAPVILESREKRFTEDGGHRTARPEEMLARCESQVSPITGIVASLGPIANRDTHLRPLYGAAYFVCPSDDRPAFGDFVRPSMGKGRTTKQARASALSEAIERYSALFQGDEPLIRASFLDLRPEALNPRSLQNFSTKQYQRREVTNRSAQDPRRQVPIPFDEHATIDWVPAWSLTAGKRRYLPASYCYFNMPIRAEEMFCLPDPNGHAAGNCLEEAILQALLELAERDGVGVWWYNRARRAKVDLSGFDEPYFISLEQDYANMGQKLWVLDVTNDLEIPTFVALARSYERGRFSVGFGCHLEARLGVQRALTELNQTFDPAERMPAPWQQREMQDDLFLLPDDNVPRRRAADFAIVEHRNLREDVDFLVAKMARHGMETVVLDQTRPDTGLNVVKVAVPGLRHIWPRFGPGRLYEVPVKLGWCDRKIEEGELNPVPLFV